MAMSGDACGRLFAWIERPDRRLEASGRRPRCLKIFPQNSPWATPSEETSVPEDGTSLSFLLKSSMLVLKLERFSPTAF